MTLESPLAVVCYQVSLQRKWGLEASFTSITLESLCPAWVLWDISVDKSLSTKLAFVRFIFIMYYFVGKSLDQVS
jgi:hypothetical protein